MAFPSPAVPSCGTRMTCPGWICSARSFSFLCKRGNTEGFVAVDDENVLGFGELHYETGEVLSAHLNVLDVSAYFAE